MSQTEEHEVDLGDVEFAILVSRTNAGEIQMSPIDEEHKPNTLDDVYEVLCILKRNIESNHQAAAVHQYMLQQAAQMQKEANANGKITDSGIVIPENKNIR